MGDIVWILSSYFIIWWMVLFAVLPLGVRNHTEAGTTPEPGHDPGAPVNPNLKRKAITTSWVAAIVTGLIWVAFKTHLIQLAP